METNPAKAIVSVLSIDCFGGGGVVTRAADGPTDSRDRYARGFQRHQSREPFDVLE